MLSLLLYIVLYYCFCIVFFSAIQRTAFCLYNRRSNPDGAGFAHGKLAEIYARGFLTDCVAAVYFTALPVIMVTTCFLSGSDAMSVIGPYNVIIAIVAGLGASSDMLLYRFWQSKIDASALGYLKSAGGAFASVSVRFIAGALILWGVFSALFYSGSEAVARFTIGSHPSAVHGAWQYVTVIAGAVIVLGLLFAVLRGLGHRPKTPSISYFSTNMFYNHCAVNADYNFIFSIAASRDNLKKRYHVYDDVYCESRSAELYPTTGEPRQKLLRHNRPNVLLIIWESLSARHFERLGGQSDVLVNLERLSRDGVLFSRCDAGSIRTDRGLVCLLGGYPCPPASCVIKYTRKLPNLPSLPRTLKHAGYATSAWHGGDLSFYHMRDYYMSCGFDTLLEEKDFPADVEKNKWGVHDGYLFDRLYEDIQLRTERKELWFTSFQTLSSHEDFKVPYNRLPDDEIANAFAYTDHVFGNFIDRLKQSPAWKNLLVIVTGDHGFYHGKGIDRDKYPHIPVVLFGGAVKETCEIDTVMSQTDIAATILGQLGIDHGDFPFSRDVLAESYIERFSFHTHQTGFFVRDDKGFTEFDNASGHAIVGDDSHREECGRVTLQQLHADLSRR